MSGILARCPASELEHGVLSLNEQDVRCRLGGHIQAAEGSPCCDDYTQCPIWRKEKDTLWQNKRTRLATSMLNTGTGEWERV